MSRLFRPSIFTSSARPNHFTPSLSQHILRPSRPPPLRFPPTRRPYASYAYPDPSGSASSILWGIIGANTLVFLSWQYALPQRNGLGPFASTSDLKLAARLQEHFILHPQDPKAGRYWTALTSAFSHIDPYHFLGNMVSLYAFGSILAAMPGVAAAHVTTLALGSAVAGSAGWLAHTSSRSPVAAPTRSSRNPFGSRPPQQRQQGALGASGMVMGMGAAAALLAPRTTMLIMGIVPVPLWALIVGYFVFDSYYLDRGGRVAHAGHLGGLAFGVAYYMLSLRRFGGVFGGRGPWGRF